MVLLDLSEYLSADELGDSVGTLIIKDEGELTTGQYGPKLEITVDFNGKIRTWSPNKTSQRLMAKMFGSADTRLWIDKVVKVRAVMENVKGVLRKVVYVVSEGGELE